MPQQWPNDNFYEDYSLSVDFGHSGKEEFKRLQVAIKKTGTSASSKNVIATLNFVKTMYPLIRANCKKEIRLLNNLVKKEKITAGIIPPDVFFACEVLLIILESSLLGLKVREFIQKRIL